MSKPKDAQEQPTPAEVRLAMETYDYDNGTCAPCTPANVQEAVKSALALALAL
jgi:hypothetical protein